MPLQSYLKEELLKREILHADETDERPIILFDYQATRGGFHAAEYLTGFSGYLHTDGYAGYEKVQNSTHCGCWVNKLQPLNGSRLGKAITKASATQKNIKDKISKFE